MRHLPDDPEIFRYGQGPAFCECGANLDHQACRCDPPETDGEADTDPMAVLGRAFGLLRRCRRLVEIDANHPFGSASRELLHEIDTVLPKK